MSLHRIGAPVPNHARGEVPLAASHLTMFVDVQGKLLFHTVVAWEDDFTGYVIDYGAYPEQRRALFTLRDVQKTLGRAAPGAHPTRTSTPGSSSSSPSPSPARRSAGRTSRDSHP